MYTFLINPTASSGHGKKVFDEVKAVLDLKKEEYEYHMLTHPGHATEITRELSKNDCHIVVLGGDGTLNEVLNGITDFSKTRFSCIRTGSGNDFARNMNVKKSAREAIAHLLLAPQETVLDYGEVTYKNLDNEEITRRFLISCGVGYDADICDEVAESSIKKVLNKFKLGKLVYLVVGIKQIFFRQGTKARLTFADTSGAYGNIAGDKSIEADNLFLAVGMIQPMEGGGVPFCPKADPTDGMLDACIICDLPKPLRLVAVMLVYMKKHLMLKKYIKAHRCKKIHMTLEVPQTIHLDGDVPSHVTEVTMRGLNGLRFVK